MFLGLCPAFLGVLQCKRVSGYLACPMFGNGSLICNAFSSHGATQCCGFTGATGSHVLHTWELAFPLKTHMHAISLFLQLFIIATTANLDQRSYWYIIFYYSGWFCFVFNIFVSIVKLGICINLPWCIAGYKWPHFVPFLFTCWFPMYIIIFLMNNKIKKWKLLSRVIKHTNKYYWKAMAYLREYIFTTEWRGFVMKKSTLILENHKTEFQRD